MNIEDKINKIEEFINNYEGIYINGISKSSNDDNYYITIEGPARPINLNFVKEFNEFKDNNDFTNIVFTVSIQYIMPSSDTRKDSLDSDTTIFPFFIFF